MSDTIERADGPTLALNLPRDNAETTPRKLTEQEARDWLAANGSGKVRDLAAQWGWHRSSVQRLLSRIASETTPAKPQMVLAVANPPIAGAGPDDFDWSADNAVVMPPRPGVAVYWNKQGDAVILVQDADNGGDDFVCLKEEALWPVIDALTEMAPRRR